MERTPTLLEEFELLCDKYKSGGLTEVRFTMGLRIVFGQLSDETIKSESLGLDINILKKSLKP